MGSRYELRTPFVSGFEPGPPVYTLSTPLLPGVELAAGAGPDALDETYLRTTLTGPDHGSWHLDETYEATTLVVSSPTVDVSPITFFPLRRKSTVQELTTVLYPGPDQNVRFGVMHDG